MTILTCVSSGCWYGFLRRDSYDPKILEAQMAKTIVRKSKTAQFMQHVEELLEEHVSMHQLFNFTCKEDLSSTELILQKRDINSKSYVEVLSITFVGAETIILWSNSGISELIEELTISDEAFERILKHIENI